MVPQLIIDKIQNGLLPVDENAVYFVLASADITEELRPDMGNAAFCQDYSGTLTL
jgi:hypothetical protein